MTISLVLWFCIGILLSPFSCKAINGPVDYALGSIFGAGAVTLAHSNAELQKMSLSAIAKLDMRTVVPSQMNFISCTNTGLATNQGQKQLAYQQQALTASQIATLSPAMVKALDITHLRAITCGSVLSGQTPKQIQSLLINALTTTSDFSTPSAASPKTPMITAYQFQSLTIPQIQLLTQSQLTTLDQAHMQAFTVDVLSNGTTSLQLQSLSTQQIQCFLPTQIGYLTKTQLANLTAAQVGALSAAQLKAIPAANFTDAFFNYLSLGQIIALPYSTISPRNIYITKAQLASLTASQLGNIDINFLVYIINHINDTQPNIAAAYQLLAPLITDAALNQLTQSLISSMSAGAIPYFSNAQLQIILGKGSLSDNQISFLSDSQVGSLTGVQLGTIMPKLNTTQQKSVSRSALVSILTSNPPVGTATWKTFTNVLALLGSDGRTFSDGTTIASLMPTLSNSVIQSMPKFGNSDYNLMGIFQNYFIPNLTGAQWQSLSTDFLTSLPGNCFTYLTVANLKSMTSAQTKAISQSKSFYNNCSNQTMSYMYNGPAWAGAPSYYVPGLGYPTP
ncbi:MAG: hypothetical protein QG604_96 [Candidatus Dependentiae bacterium]|nr:hypothetical protein [Candidatus Dependentiae bacterium]